MSETNQEILNLKKKCNAQIDVILKMKETLKESRLECDEKQRKIEELTNELNSLNAEKSPFLNTNDDNLFLECARTLKNILIEITEKNIIIEYQYNSANAKEFMRVPKDKLDVIIVDLIGQDKLNYFIEFCTNIGIMKIDKGKFVFGTGNSKFYMFSKKAVEFVNKKV